MAVELGLLYNNLILIIIIIFHLKKIDGTVIINQRVPIRLYELHFNLEH